MNFGFLLFSSFYMISAAEGFWANLRDNFFPNLAQITFGESCPVRDEIIRNIPSLINRFKNDVVGQHLVEDNLIPIVRNHLLNEPRKPLVICMHGWTGSGKNYVTQILVETLYEKGLNSKNVHLFSGRLHFPLSTREAVNEYTVNLHNWIQGNVSQCGLSTFIFDEIDKIPGDVIEAIKPFLDYHVTLNNVDYRNSIFIFISNIGGNAITKKYLELWESGISRMKMEYKHFEPVLRKTLYNMEGAFERSSILENHLVSLYLPFLPMEKVHVKLCIQNEMIRQRTTITPEDIDEVLNGMEFYKDRFSVSGCKRVSDQVALLKYKLKDEL